MRFYEPVAGVEGVAAGATATVKIPTNRRLHALKIFATADGPIFGNAVVGEIFVYVGSRLQRIITANELADIANLNGRVVVPATDPISIFFAEPWRASVMDEQVLSWDLWNVAEMTLKIRILGAIVNPALTVLMDYDDGFTTNGQGQRVLNVVRHSPFNFNAGTTYDITALDIDKPIQRIYIYPADGTSITSVKAVVNDSVTVHEMTAAQNAQFLADYGLVYTPAVTVRYPLCFDLEQQVFNALNPPRSLRLTVVQSLAGALKVVLENRATSYV